MRNILTVFKKEIDAYFNSAIAYIFIIVFLLISSGLFMTQFFLISTADMRGFFFSIPVILCIFLPAVTMRLWTEEREVNTLELLLTFPIRTYELVLGKFLASFLFYLTAVVSTLTIPIMLTLLGKPDLGAIISQYIGVISLGAFFLSLGIFVSGFFKDQIVSFIISMMVCFTLFLVGTDFTASSIDGWIPGMGMFLRNALGMSQHFITFQKGIIDIRDILYFLAGTAIFLTLNTFWLEIKARVKSRSIFTATCFISTGIFVLLNVIFSDMPVGRFDLTEGRIYTISKATRDIIDDLRAPVIVKLFISPADKMPSNMKTLERDIRDKLDELKVVSNGKFDYKVFHMEAANVASEDEESLEKSIEKKGIRPFQVSSIEADEVGVKLIYSALSIAYKEKPEEIIPGIVPGNLFTLEYTLISKIYRMTLTETPSIGLVAPYVERAVDPQMQQVLQMLGQSIAGNLREDEYELIPRLLQYEGYKTSRIQLTEQEPIPEDTTTLVILEPSEFNDRQLFEINRFLVNGGSIFMAVQQYDFMYETFGRDGLRINPIDKKPQTDGMLEKWGLGISKDYLMDTQMEIVSVGGGSFMGLFPASSPVKLPMQLKVISGQMNNEISITSNISSLFYFWGNALTLDDETLERLNLSSKVLFTSSSDAWSVGHHYGALTKDDITRPPRLKGTKFPLALFVKGQFPDAFEGRVPEWPRDPSKSDESYEMPEEDIKLTPEPGKLILTGCSKMFTKQIFTSGGHVNFFLNSIDALTLGEKLVKVRSKQLTDRSLKKISPAAKVGWKIFTTILIPLALCVVGGLRVFMRKRSKWLYLKKV